MERRELIRLVTLATGAALAVPLSSSLLTACNKVEKIKDSNYMLSFFNDEDFSSLQKMLDIIIPKTDSPSAVDVGVHQIIDTMIGKVYNPEQQKEFSEKFAALNTYAGSNTSMKSFKTLMASEDKNDQIAKTGLLELKQQAVAYYLSTEEVGKNYLNYLPVPGAYEPCISLESVDGKAWAL